jgi:hypothetical protein
MWFYVLVTAAALAAWLYRQGTKNYGYFASRGVAEEAGAFPFGSDTHKRVVQGKVSFVLASGWDCSRISFVKLWKTRDLIVILILIAIFFYRGNL